MGEKDHRSQDFLEGGLRRCLMCMYACKTGGSGGMLPEKFYALRLFLRPFWDSRAVVATWLVEYRIQFLVVHVCLHAKPADFEFPQEKVLRLAEQQVGTIGELALKHLQMYLYARIRAVAIRFGVIRLVVCAQECYTLGGAWGHAPPGKF